jgi:hypothetical protein
LIRPFVTEQEIEQNPYVENVEAQQIAAHYNQMMGFPLPQPVPYVPVNLAVAKQIAQIYGRAPNSPDDPEVQEAYVALINEVDAQYALLPIEIIPVGGENYPYKSSPEMMDDVLHNRRMFVFDGGDDHAILTREQNFKFRAVHDYFGHTQHGFAFGPRGEENAWMEHSKMFSPVARKALTTETRGQNSWVNFGPNSHLPVTERPYAEQKVFVLPPQFVSTPVLEEAYREYPGFYPSTVKDREHRYVAALHRQSREDMEHIERRRNKGVKMVEPKVGSHLIKTRGGESVRQGTLFDIERPKLPRKLKQVTWCMRDTHLNRLRHYYQKGIGGKHWYDTTYPSIVDFFNGNVERANLFVYLLASTSPLTNIRENIQRALHALQVGEQFGATATVFEEHIPFEAHRLNVLRSFRGEPLSGPKVTNFAKNLFGPEFRDKSGKVAFPDAADAVTVDRWVMRAVQGICNPEDASIKDDAPTEPQYRCIEDAIKKLAYAEGVQPRQYQAAVWVGIKIECGDMNDTTNPFDVELRSVADKISNQQRFDFDFDPEYNSFEKGLEAVVFYEGRRGKKNPPEALIQIEEDVLDPGMNGEYILENVNG